MTIREYIKLFCDRPRAAFTLMEINLTILVISIGLLGVLGLFPVGLRQGSMAIDETNQALFASRLLGIMRSEAATITEVEDWRNFSTVIQTKLQGSGFDLGEHTLKEYLGTDNSIRYSLNVEKSDDVEHSGQAINKKKKSNSASPVPRVWRATLRVTDREVGDITMQRPYVADFTFFGTPPSEIW